QRLLGETYLKQGHLDEARQTFDWVLTNDPENVVVYCDRAFISENMSDYETALDCYQQAYELSRGNSQIRQKFNQLSAKAGQQGFMFSRAGLARLYMRGNLLPRAIQEWEAVLAVSPDRLDARLGLLEACWREGFYERTELLAAQILSDVPTCLKALLILAHVVSGRDMQKSQQLIKRAETLDPELVMAQELFGDTIASQPNNPFVKVLKKPPVLLVDMPSQAGASPALAVPNGTMHLQDDGINIPAVSSDILSNWQGLDNWNEKDAGIQSQQEKIVTPQEVALAQVDTLQDQQQDVREQQQIHDNAALAKGAAIQDVRHSAEQLHVTEQQDSSALPAWLSMLTQDEQSSPEGYEQSLPSEHAPAQQPSFSVEPPSTSGRSWQDELAVAPGEDKVPFSFGPEWLKALGAAIMESEFSEESTSAQTHLSPTAHVPEPSSLLNTLQASTSAAQADQRVLAPQDDALAQAQQASRMADQPQHEQDFITMLEVLERDLRSQGFVPMEPNSLANITRAQSTVPDTSAYDPLQSEQESAEVSQESALSSALARLGNLSPQSPVLTEPPTSVTMHHQESLSSTPVHAPVSTAFTANVSQASPVPPSLYYNMPPDVAHSAMHQPSPVQITTAEPAKAGVAHYDEHWDELEATMKRPAVHLQSKAAARPAETLAAGRRTTEKLSVGADDNLTHRQRLVKGYQHQLLGDYDEAMQEYRIIIPSAPELLDEVVSNVRALLKISPRYAAGYRVLGDAYMRLGEYLQAMEAYNKALAMAKRVKSSQDQ
ncbi:MAG: tetratricopeptide repeat protein, partial [Ktedonobacteraceae bacterium]|nr:tetratricopeptide repeat protein [Ktedonobacteraceae bacterium]